MTLSLLLPVLHEQPAIFFVQVFEAADVKDGSAGRLIEGCRAGDELPRVLGEQIAEGGEAKVYDHGATLIKSIGLDYFIQPVFALDRIETLTLTEKTFDLPENFDLQRHFQDAFGIYVEPDLATEEVIVKADTDQSNFLKGLPLHHSQRVIDETATYCVFSWRLKPSYDFIQELLKMNAHIEVLEPLSLRKQFKELLRSMLAKY